MAREFDVPYHRLRGRIADRGPLLNHQTYPKALDEVQEKAVTLWIWWIDALGISPTPGMVVQCANEILAQSAKTPPKTPSNLASNLASDLPSNPPRIVSKNWVYRFIDRLPEDLYITTQKPIEKARFDAEDVAKITHWFDLLEKEIQKQQIGPQNIYNIDDSGIQIGQNSSQRVVTQHPQRRLRSSDTRQSITIIEGVAAEGFVIAPWFIFNGEG